MIFTRLASKRGRLHQDQLRNGSAESFTKAPEPKQQRQRQRQPTSNRDSSSSSSSTQQEPKKRRKLRINVRSHTASYDVEEYPGDNGDSQQTGGTTRDFAADQDIVGHLRSPGDGGPDHWERTQVGDATAQLSDELAKEIDFSMNWGDKFQELLAGAMLVSEPKLVAGRHSNAFVDNAKPETHVSPNKEDDGLQWSKLWEEEGRCQGQALDLTAVESNIAIVPSNLPAPGWLCNAPERGALDFLERGDEGQSLPALSDWEQECDEEEEEVGEEQGFLRVPWLPQMTPPPDAENQDSSSASGERFDWEWEEDDDDQEPEIDWVAAFRTRNG